MRRFVASRAHRRVVLRTRNLRGFTLPEVLVTLAIVATLAAVLVPALMSQLSKGDAGRAVSDLQAVETAIGAYVSDVRRYPVTLGQLSTKPINTAPDILTNQLSANLTARWRGPYLTKALAGGTDSTLQTGFGADISKTFTAASYNAIQYVRIDVSPLTEAQADQMDLIIDDAASSSTGRFRFSGSTGSYFAVPIQ